jgi:hypothetical protein
LVLQLVGVAGFVLALSESHQRRRWQREQQARAVTVRIEEDRADVTSHSYRLLGRRIVVRNDSDRPVRLDAVHLVFGETHVYGELQPTYLTYFGIGPGEMPSGLDPGGSLSFPAPTKETAEREGRSWPGDTQQENGPGVTFTDADGRQWHRSEVFRLRPVGRINSTPMRPQGLQSRWRWWVERRRWFNPVNRWFIRRAARKVEKRPTRTPWEVLLLDLLWGWRPGKHDPVEMAPGAPRNWRYEGLFQPKPRAGC